MSNLRERCATAVMLLIALSAAVLSFNTLAEVGSAPGLFPKPWGGWLWAGAVDGFITLGFLSIPAGGRQALYARVQIAVGFVASLVFQLGHAQGISWPLAVAAVPPLAVVLSVESWWLSRRADGAEPAESDARESSPLPTVKEAGRATVGDAGKVLANHRWEREAPNGQVADAQAATPFPFTPQKGGESS